MNTSRLKARAHSIRRIARKHGVTRLRVFGPYASGTASSKSDVDLLISLSMLKPTDLVIHEVADPWPRLTEKSSRFCLGPPACLNMLPQVEHQIRPDFDGGAGCLRHSILIAYNRGEFL